MDERILIGAIVGVGTVSSIYIWKSENFSKAQKAILLVCILFLPLQWILVAIMHTYNRKNEIVLGFKQDKSVKNLEKLKHLKSSGILSNEEYKIKTKKLKTEFNLYDVKKTKEYKALSNLNKQGILTNVEFDEKVKSLLNKRVQYTHKKSNLKTSNSYYKIKLIESRNTLLGTKIEIYKVKFNDNLKGKIHVIGEGKTNYFEDKKNFSSTLKRYYENPENCILALHQYLKTGNIKKEGYVKTMQ